MKVIGGEYIIIGKPFPGMARLKSKRYGVQLWVCSVAPGRKHKECVSCDRDVKGIKSYRPMGNPMNRMMRICERCIEITEISGY